MGRFYTVNFSGVGTTAAVDLFELIAASGKPFILHEVVIGQTTDYGDAQDEGLRVDIKRATGSYTTGSGGTTPTPAKHATNDSSAGSSAKANNTTQASAGSGALTTVRSETFNVRSGYQYLPTPESRLLFLGGEACVISLTAPADSLTMNGSATIEEL